MLKNPRMFFKFCRIFPLQRQYRKHHHYFRRCPQETLRMTLRSTKADNKEYYGRRSARSSVQNKNDVRKDARKKLKHTSFDEKESYVRVKKRRQKKMEKSRKEKQSFSLDFLSEDILSACPSTMTGVLKFDKHANRCYVLQHWTGVQLKTRCAFDFTAGFIPLSIFSDRIKEDYDMAEQYELTYILSRWKASEMTNEEFSTQVKKFC